MNPLRRALREEMKENYKGTKWENEFKETRKGMCENCSLKCIASGCECVCHNEKERE